MPLAEELFEASSPLGARLAGKRQAEGVDVIAEARRLLPELSEAERVATLNAHPRIGERTERMSARSRQEQGTDQLPRLEALNRRYEARFGFRFVTFVAGRSKPAILEELGVRLERSRAEEMETGLEAIIAIAEARLRA
jgi:2-oxo-4-hydroxy-4-carboxy--5-ureidoimidazoline (OHCU) decarboxylase